MSNKHLANTLALDSTIVIGSRALDVQTEGSDLDICVYAKDISSKSLEGLKEVYSYTNGYAESLLMEHSTLYQGDHIDIFVFSDYEKLAIVKKVMFTMKNYPKFVLRAKWIRVAMFRHLLRKEGFLNEESNRPFTDIGTKDV